MENNNNNNLSLDLRIIRGELLGDLFILQDYIDDFIDIDNELRDFNDQYEETLLEPVETIFKREEIKCRRNNNILFINIRLEEDILPKINTIYHALGLLKTQLGLSARGELEYINLEKIRYSIIYYLNNKENISDLESIEFITELILIMIDIY